MLVRIIHDSQYGNGKMLAESMGKVFEQKAEVKIAHIKDVTPKQVVEEEPTVLIIGTAVRMFMVSNASKKWIKNLIKELKDAGKQIPYGAVFVTHMLNKKRIEKKGNRFYELIKSGNIVKTMHPEWLEAQVEGIEGPLKPGSIERFTAESEKILQNLL